jgi:hypothetical protein
MGVKFCRQDTQYNDTLHKEYQYNHYQFNDT